MKNLVLFLLVIFFSAEIYSQPLPPTDLTAEQNNWGSIVRVQLTWTPPTTTNTVRYNIYRKDGSLSDTIPFVKIHSRFFNIIFYDRYVQSGQTYSYYVTAVNMQGESDPSNYVEITLGAAATKGTIAGQILNEGSNLPIPGARATIIPLLGGHNITAFADSNGNFLAKVFPGNYYVRSTAFGFIPEFFDNAPTIETAQQITVAGEDSFYLPVALAPYVPPVLYTVTGNVSDAGGNPMFAVIHGYTTSPVLCANRGYRSWTDSLGNFTLNIRENDTIVIFIKPFNFDFLPEFYDNKSTFEDADRIAVTGNITGINVILDPRPVYPNGITGLVSNSLNEPVLSFVRATRKTLTHFNKRSYFTVTDSLGVYSFNNMFPGEYILLACPFEGYSRTYFRYDGVPTLNWFEADSVVVTDNGIVTGINFNVVALPTDGFAAVSGFATDREGNPINGAHIFAVDENRNIFTYTVTDNNGYYLLSGLQPGGYRLYSDKIDYTSNSGTPLNINSIIQNSQVNFILTPEAVTGVEDLVNITSYELYQNYPNPFNPSTTIKFAVPEQGLVKLSIYDMLGREVTTLVNEVVNAGMHSIQFDASSLSSGVYLYKIQATNFSSAKKLMLLK